MDNVHSSRSSQIASEHHAIFTVGHSTREFSELLRLLKLNEIVFLVDIRRFPGSRRNPAFNKDVLKTKLPQSGIQYAHVEELGGRREPIPAATKNAVWKNPAFRGYADHMSTSEFACGLEKLFAIADREHETSHAAVCIMCAEALPWRCHRFLLSDALVANQFEVLHIVSGHNLLRHKINDLAAPERIPGSNIVTVQYSSHDRKHQKTL